MRAVSKKREEVWGRGKQRVWGRLDKGGALHMQVKQEWSNCPTKDACSTA